MTEIGLSVDLATISKLLESAKSTLQEKQASDEDKHGQQKLLTKIPKIISSSFELPSYFEKKFVMGLKKDELVENSESYINDASFEPTVPIYESHVSAPGISKKKKNIKDTAGSNWFDMPATELTESVKRDIQLLKMRNALDPKRHYRRENTKSMPKYFQVGSIVEGPQDFYSSRIPTRERKETIVDELLHDSERRSYFKKKYLELQKSKMSGRKGQYKKLQQRRKPSYLK